MLFTFYWKIPKSTTIFHFLLKKVFGVYQIYYNLTLVAWIITGVGIIGGLDIVIIINNMAGGGAGQGWKNSVGGFLVLIC